LQPPKKFLGSLPPVLQPTRIPKNKPQQPRTEGSCVAIECVK
jgi:hypothetical protein